MYFTNVIDLTFVNNSIKVLVKTIEICNMSCVGCKSLSKKKIIILASITSVAAVILYHSFTINPITTLTALPFLLLPLIGCVVMFGVILGFVFLAGRFSKKSDESNDSSYTSKSNDMNETITSIEINRDNEERINQY